MPELRFIVSIGWSFGVAALAAAAQDVADLKDRIAGSPSIVGWVNVKYQPRNPSNSIIICEEWSGLRTNGRGAGERNGSAS